jgi:signal transduction histidine kinase/ligand-binding sensor domain-containing protein/CheY-like chemotaxis protein
MRKQNLYITLIVIIFLSGTISVFSQNSYSKFYHISRNTGLSQSTINCIIKDTTGYMWFGTNDGLNRYNGYTFQYFKHNPHNPNSLGLGRVLCMYISKDGKLWVGTDQGGLNLFNPEKEIFTHYLNTKGNLNTLASNDVRAIIEDEQGNLYIACYGGGISYFDKKTELFSSILLSDNNVNCLEYDMANNLLAGTLTGVEVLKNAKIDPKPTKPEKLEKLNGIFINTIFNDSRGTLWFGTYGIGVYSFNLIKNEWTHYNDNSNKDYRINYNIVRAFSEDSKHNILIGTGGGGINLISDQNKVTGSIQNHLNNQYSISSDIVYSLYKDDKNNLWVGTYNTGVDINFVVKDKFNHLRSFGDPNSLSKNAVLSITQDKEGNFWIGTDGGGLNKYDPKTNTFKHYLHSNTEPGTISGNVAKSLFLDKNNILWIGTFNAGLNAFNIKTETFKNYIHDNNNPNSIASNHIWDIDQDADGNLWLATLSSGLDCFNPVTNSITHYIHNSQDSTSLSDNQVSVVEIDSKGNTWIGTEYGGISMMKNKHLGKFTNFRRTDYANGSLSSNQICTIYEDSKGQIWVGTVGGGIDAYIESTGRFVTLNEEKGLPSNLVYAFLEDKESNLWISSNNGLSKFLRTSTMLEKPIFQNFDLSDGLQSNEFSPQASYKTSTGEMYFGGINGINSFIPDSLKLNQSKPPVIITDFKIFNKSVEVGTPGSPLQKSISHTKALKLNYSQSVITFEFAALDFVMPLKNRYKFKLIGFEDNWNDVGNQRTATYTNLNPGKYIFKVIGSNNDGIWNENGASIEIFVTPPYYKTWWFRITVVLLITLLIYLYYRRRLNDFETQQKKLKNMVDERTSDLLSLNKLRENQNKEIANQKSELILQKENLLNANLELEKKQIQIQQQNEELEQHRHNLQNIVAQRTSELEKAKLKAEESEQLKMAFLSNMSHEIRTPMNAIIGFSSLLADDDITDKERQDFIRLINTNGESLLVLIDDILDLSRIEANQIEIKKTIFNIFQFISDLYINYKQTKSVNKKFEFILTALIDQNRQIETDQHRLRQILVNLLDNAFKFTTQGSIELKIIELNQQFIFTVNDTGIGIDEDAIPYIFDRFRKGNENSNKLYRGAGLGLAISKRLAELLNGQLNVESTVKKGSKFTLAIPAIPELAQKKVNISFSDNFNPSTKIDFKGLTILIVEDEEDNYLYLNNLLKRRNTQIYWAKDGRLSVEMNKTLKPEIILMDIKMPEMDGYEALKLIKADTPDTPVIAQTAFARIEEENKIRAAGFDDYISKPVLPLLLYNILSKFSKRN